MNPAITFRNAVAAAVAATDERTVAEALDTSEGQVLRWVEGAYTPIPAAQRHHLPILRRIAGWPESAILSAADVMQTHYGTDDPSA